MMHRFLALALALVVWATPIATEACAATCAAHDAESTAPRHACHLHAVAASGAQVAAIHVCGHDDGLSTALDRASHIVQSPAITSTIILPALPVHTIRVAGAAIDSSPPALNLISQLRL